MGAFSIWHLLILGAVVLLLFGGGGKISRLMRDMGKGITAFKKGLKEEVEDPDEAAGDKSAIEQNTMASSATQEEQDKKVAGG